MCIRDRAETLLGLRLTVGVGLAVETPGQLARSVQGAKSALDYRSILGPGRTLYIGDLEPRGAVADVYKRQNPITGGKRK